MPNAATLLFIRHGEKPTAGLLGADQNGNADPDGLIPRGWQRAGALVTLFAPNGTTLSSTLPSPGALVTPQYPQPGHRPYFTVSPLSDRLGVSIQSAYPVDTDPASFVKYLLTIDADVILTCWEHQHLVNIVQAVGTAVPVTNAGDVPTAWPDDRFDVIWRFDLNNQTGEWSFSSMNQQLLAGDQVGAI
jgi:hypothetical protein